MSRIKLTKTLVEAARPRERDYELRDALTPGFLLKVTPAGGKVFMLAYTNSRGRRRKPAIGRFGELTVEQARAVARDWLADDSQLRNASHHGGLQFRRKSGLVVYRAGKGGQGTQVEMGYATYLAQCARLVFQCMVLLRLELLITTRTGNTPPL